MATLVYNIDNISNYISSNGFKVKIKELNDKAAVL